MNNTTLRLLVFALGLPVIALSAFAFPEYSYPVFAFLVTGSAALSALEVAGFFSVGPLRYPGNRIVIPLIGAALPAVTYGYVLGFWGVDALAMTFVLLSAVILFVQVLRRNSGEFVDILPAVVSHTFILIYPGLFASYAMRLLTFDAASRVIIVFVFSVYLNDSAAWLFGRLFARRRPGDEEVVVPVSPNKSVIGFIGGMVATIVVLFGARYIWPGAFSAPFPSILGSAIIIGVAAISGDLVESALKRSAAVKDSGTMIPGRGGLLDSIDSPLFAAPVFFYLYHFVFYSSNL